MKILRLVLLIFMTVYLIRNLNVVWIWNLPILKCDWLWFTSHMTFIWCSMVNYNDKREAVFGFWIDTLKSYQIFMHKHWTFDLFSAGYLSVYWNNQWPFFLLLLQLFHQFWYVSCFNGAHPFCIFHYHYQCCLEMNINSNRCRMENLLEFSSCQFFFLCNKTMK